MKKKRPDLEDTQEIIIPREKSDYGDGFDNNDSTNISQTSKHKSSDTLKKDTNFKRNIIIISCIVAAVIILVVGLIVFISLNSSSEKTIDVTNTTVVTSYSTKPTMKYFYSDSSNTTIEPKEEKVTEEPSTEELTTAPTEEVKETETVKEITTTEPKVAETEKVETSEIKQFSVTNILVYKTDDGIYIPKVMGTFSGYTPEELLEQVTVKTTKGTPSVSTPHIENGYFTFNLNLDECEGTLNIHADMFDYVSDISIL